MINKVKCDNCKKIIHKHIFDRLNKTLCADCYSIEFQKELNNGKYFIFYKKEVREEK
jgi:hypothetical protein